MFRVARASTHFLQLSVTRKLDVFEFEDTASYRDRGLPGTEIHFHRPQLGTLNE